MTFYYGGMTGPVEDFFVDDEPIAVVWNDIIGETVDNDILQGLFEEEQNFVTGLTPHWARRARNFNTPWDHYEDMLESLDEALIMCGWEIALPIHGAIQESIANTFHRWYIDADTKIRKEFI